MAAAFASDLRAAVGSVLHDPTYRSRARLMATEMSEHDPFEAIATIVETPPNSAA